MRCRYEKYLLKYSLHTLVLRLTLKFGVSYLKYNYNLFLGTAGIIMAAPSHYDTTQPIDIKYSKIEAKNQMMKKLIEEARNNQ